MPTACSECGRPLKGLQRLICGKAGCRDRRFKRLHPDAYAERERAKVKRRRARRRAAPNRLEAVTETLEPAGLERLPQPHTGDYQGDCAEGLTGAECPDDEAGNREGVESSKRQHEPDDRPFGPRMGLVAGESAPQAVDQGARLLLDAPRRLADHDHSSTDVTT